jgi:hypothetical protein
MIVRAWSSRVPLGHGAGFHQHMLAAGVEDYRRQPGCRDVELWRRDEPRVAQFMLACWWRGMAAVRQYAGEEPAAAVLHPGEGRYELVPYSPVMQVSGERTAYVSGQVPHDRHRRLAGHHDGNVQAEQSFSGDATPASSTASAVSIDPTSGSRSRSPRPSAPPDESRAAVRP